MVHFFISYSRVDGETAEHFKGLLEQQSPGSSVFLDTHSLYGGYDWWEEILDSIERCDIFFYLLSNDSVQSDYCRTEFEFARQLRKPVITVQIRDRTKLTGDLQGIQYVDMSPGENEAQAMAKLSGSIQLQLAEKKRRPASRKRPAKPGSFEETPRAADVPQVQTPPVEVPRMVEKPWWQKPEYIVPLLAATITGLFGVLQVILANGDLPTPTPPSTILVVTATQNAVNQTALPTTVLPPPTDTPTHKPTDTPIPVGFPGGDRVTSTPVVRPFNGVDMVMVPTGCFDMGSTVGDPDEQPVHEQCFNEPFWIDRFEVSNGQFDRLGGEAEEPSQWSDPDLPRENISWDEAVAFCQLRGARLPTEREWEYAARGPDNLIYPWGIEFVGENVIHILSEGYGDTQPAPVDRREDVASSWVGAYDLSGNVWEWTISLYDKYPYDETDGRESNDDTNSDRVLRGGSFKNTLYGVRAAFRNSFAPNTEREFLGFRCARDYE